jgi:glycosyltransferase involved in cell wall biosynthesis
MADPPRVSVITPTWERHELLLSRCIPSVAAQDYKGRLEHVVVSDGPDPELVQRFTEVHESGFRRLLRCMPEHDPAAQWGHHARLGGIAQADGEYIAYLDDDNSWRPDHLRLLVAALEAHPDAGFAYPLMAVHGRGEYVIGSDPPCGGQIDTSMIVHRRELLDVATWRWYPDIPTIDWDLVSRWTAGGASWVRVPQVTCDYYFHG